MATQDLWVSAERRALLSAGVMTIAGVIFGARWIAPVIPPVIGADVVHCAGACIGIVLVLLNREGEEARNLQQLTKVILMTMATIPGFRIPLSLA